MKFKRIYFFGGNKKDGENDFIDRYEAENGMEIYVVSLFDSPSCKWYSVNGRSFDTLRAAKQYVSKIMEV